MLKELLEKAGCDVTVYTGCIEAISKSARADVDIWIVDYEMPQMNGIEFIKLLRESERNQNVPILMLTSRTHGEILVEAIQAGADAFVEKKHVKEIIFAQLLALARLKKIYEDLLKTKQLDAIKTFIGTYKHEFGNSLTIVNGKISKLVRTYPEIANDEALGSVKNGLVRMTETLKKLDELRSYEEESYVNSTMTLKLRKTG